VWAWEAGRSDWKLPGGRKQGLAGLWTKESALPNDARKPRQAMSELGRAMSWSGEGGGPRYINARHVRCNPDAGRPAPVCARRAERLTVGAIFGEIGRPAAQHRLI
jgi:hypothetical protein